MSGVEVDVATLETALAGGAPLIDVRQPEEFTGVRVRGSVLIPLGEMVERIDEVPTDATVYVICHSGARSLKVALYLRNQGIDAYSVEGGVKEWSESGRPTESG